MSDLRATIVVTQAVAINLRELSRRLGKIELAGMFVSGCSATGNAPATHYVSSGHLPRQYVETMLDPVLLFQRAKKAWEDDGDVFPYTQNQVTNQLGNCTVHVGEVDARALLLTLGLRVISE